MNKCPRCNKKRERGYGYCACGLWDTRPKRGNRSGSYVNTYSLTLARNKRLIDVFWYSNRTCTVYFFERSMLGRTNQRRLELSHLPYTITMEDLDRYLVLM